MKRDSTRFARANSEIAAGTLDLFGRVAFHWTQLENYFLIHFDGMLVVILFSLIFSLSLDTTLFPDPPSSIPLLLHFLSPYPHPIPSPCNYSLHIMQRSLPLHNLNHPFLKFPTFHLVLSSPLLFIISFNIIHQAESGLYSWLLIIPPNSKSHQLLNHTTPHHSFPTTLSSQFFLIPICICVSFISTPVLIDRRLILQNHIS